MMMIRHFLLHAFFLCALAATLNAEPRQFLLSIAENWDSPAGKMQRFEEGKKGEWRPVGEPVPVLFGKKGLAWGTGLHPQEKTGPQKVEKDLRSPAGVFAIGKIYTYDAQLPKGSNYPFVQVTEADAWVDDPNNPHYNRHVRIDPSNPPAWFESQKMRHGDFAYRWLVEIRHNSDPPVPGHGSAMFFHIRRGVNRSSAGCTTMAEENLVEMIKWLRSGGQPRYALLPKAEYEQQWKSLGLPSPKAAAALLQ